MQWSQMRFNTCRLLISPLLKPNIDASTTNESSNPTSATQKEDMIRDILIREGPNVSSMKSAQLISLARMLGCKGGQPLKSQSAKAYINKLLNEYNLLKK